MRIQGQWPPQFYGGEHDQKPGRKGGDHGGGGCPDEAGGGDHGGPLQVPDLPESENHLNWAFGGSGDVAKE